MRNRPVILLLSIVLGLCVYLGLMGRSIDRDKGKVSKGDEGLTGVVVAIKGVGEGTRIARDMTEEKRVPKEQVLPGALTPNRKVVGRIVKDSILAGEQVVESRLVPEGSTFGLAAMVPQGYRALTIGLTGDDAGALMNPGDTVDVLVTLGDKGPVQRTILVVTGSGVLAVGRNISRDAAGATVEVKSITLALTPPQVEKVALAQETGTISLALHPAAKEATRAPGTFTMAELAPGAFNEAFPQASLKIPLSGPDLRSKEVRAKVPGNGEGSEILIIRGSQVARTVILR